MSSRSSYASLLCGAAGPSWECWQRAGMGLVLAIGAGKEGQQTSQAALLALSSLPPHC